MSGAVLTLLGAGSAASAVTITVDTAFISAFNAPGFTASAQYTLDSNGAAYETVNGAGAVLLYDWCVPAAQAANYEVYASLVSGSVSGAATDTWLPLSSTRAWSVSTTGGVVSGELNVGIRRVGTTTILDSADIYLYAEAT